jgi:hypothetical protein
VRPLRALTQAPGAAVLLLLLAGCGSTAAERPPPVRPHLPHALARDWARQADAVAAALASGDGCLAQQRAVALRTAVIANERRIGRRFQEPLTSAVNELAERIACTPPAPPPPAPHGPPGKGHGPGKPKGHEQHEGHGKHKGHDH